MKKFLMCLAGALLVLSLAACAPTQVKKESTAPVPQEATTGGASDKVPDPNVEPMDIVSIYSSNAVSYTHLDVYKRQGGRRHDEDYQGNT